MHPPTTSAPRPIRTTPAIALALVLLMALAVGGWATLNSVTMAPGTAIPKEALEPLGDPPVDALALGPKKVPRHSGPGWERMTTPQKLALYPLAERWAYLSEAQKRRWLALAENFASMPEEEQSRLHERMTAWASLSAQQRSQARLNFAVTRELAPQDIQSQWEAYQALSEIEKKRLASHAAKTRGAATALKPVPSKRLAHVPAAPDTQAPVPNPPKIVLPSVTAVRAPSTPEPSPLPPAPAASVSAGTIDEALRAGSESTPLPQPSDPLPDPYIN